MCRKVIYLIASIFAHIAIHECGHIVGGKNSGYDLVSTQIGLIRLEKQDGRWRFFSRKSFVLGMTYMVPKKNNCSSYVSYTLGGVVFNVVFSVAAYLIPLCFSRRISELCKIFSMMGLFFAIGNLLPFWNDTHNNDGNSLYVLNRNKKARKDYFTLLQIEKRILQGEHITDIEEKLFKTDTFDNVYSIELAQDYSYYLLLKDRYDEQIDILEKMISSEEMLVLDDDCIYKAMVVENLLLSKAEAHRIKSALGNVNMKSVNRKDPVLYKRLQYELSLCYEGFGYYDKERYYQEYMSILTDIDNRTDGEIAICMMKKCENLMYQGENSEIRNKKH